MDELEEIKRKKLAEMMKKAQGPEMPSTPFEVTDATLEEAIRKYPALVVDFWATWCQPCRMVAPVIDSLAKDYAGKVAFAKLDVDRNQRSAMRYQAMSIPTLLFFKEGRHVDRVVGALPRPALEARVRRLL
jgi:thioredoxin 1